MTMTTELTLGKSKTRGVSRNDCGTVIVSTGGNHVDEVNWDEMGALPCLSARSVVIASVVAIWYDVHFTPGFNWIS